MWVSAVRVEGRLADPIAISVRNAYGSVACRRVCRFDNHELAVKATPASTSG